MEDYEKHLKEAVRTVLSNISGDNNTQVLHFSKHLRDNENCDIGVEGETLLSLGFIEGKLHFNQCDCKVK